MTFTRRGVIGIASAALSAPMILRSGSARGQAAVTLKLHHFLPPVSNGHAKLLAPWAKQIEADSQGALKIDIYPAMQLGGTPPQLYDQARDGVADIVWTLPGTTAGRFPTTEVFELPFIASSRSAVNSRACQELGDAHLGPEVRDVHLLGFFAHDAGLIHAARAIKTMEDFKGLKLRNPTRLAGEALKALGATSIGMPINQVPESLAQRVIDGCVIPWEVVPAVKVHELLKFHTAIPGSPTFYTATFFLAMNKPKYESLPAELKAVLDKNSGMAFAARAGNMWDTEAVNVSEMVKMRGNSVTTISEEERARWVETTKPVHAAWVDQVKAKGLDGAKLIDTAKALIAKYDKV